MDKEHKVNHQIRVKEVDVVLPDGKIRKGVPLRDAMEIADGLELDLVEVSPPKGNSLSVCKVTDYGKMKYKESKRVKSHKQVIKEIKFGISISDHDLQTKNNQVHRFLEKRHLVKYSVELRGRREQGMFDLAMEKMKKCLKEFEGEARWPPIKISHGGRMTRVSTMLSPS